MVSNRERREERKYASTKKWAKSVGGGAKQAFVIPDGTTSYELKTGKKKIDLIPFVAGEGNPIANEGDLYFERTYYSHRDSNPNGSPVICLSRTFNKKCPICEHRKKLEQDPEVDKDTIKSLLPKKRQLFNVYDHGDPEKGVQLFDISEYCFGEAIKSAMEAGDDDQYEGFWHIDSGYSLKIIVVQESMPSNKFMFVKTVVFIPREDRFSRHLLKSALCLDELIVAPNYNDVKEAFMPEKDDDEDEDEDDDEDEMDDEDENEDDAVHKRPVKGKKPDPDDEDEDDEDEDDEDEDDEPKKRSASGARGNTKAGRKTAPLDDEDDFDDEDEE